MRSRPRAGDGPRPTPGPGRSEGAAGDDKAELTLGKDQREYLWQIEHHGLILSRLGFARIAKAIKNDDAPALLSLLSDGFEGEVLGEPREVRFDRDDIRLFRQTSSGRPSVRLDRKALAALLLEDRHRFAKIPTVKLALMGLCRSTARISTASGKGLASSGCTARWRGDGPAKSSSTSAIAFPGRPRSS